MGRQELRGYKKELQELKEYKKELSERFVKIDFAVSSALTTLTLVVDKETGIEYMLLGQHLTPILTPDGKPKINTKWQAGDL